MGFIFKDKPPDPPKEQKNWLGMPKVDPKTGMPKVRRVDIPGSKPQGGATKFRVTTTSDKQRNSIRNLKHQLAKNGGVIDMAWNTPEGVVTVGHNSKGEAVEIRHNHDGTRDTLTR